MPKPTPVFQDIKAQLIEANEQRTVTNEQVMELNTTFNAMYAIQEQGRLDGLEASREASNAIGKQQAGLNAAASGLAGETEKKTGGFLSKLLAGGVLIAAGTAIAAVVAGILAFMKLDVDKIVANVKKLFTIGDMADSLGDAFEKGGKFFLIMSGIGAGLAIFGVGSAVAGLSQAVLDNFGSSDWAQTIVDNVGILLSINNLIPEDSSAFKEGGNFLVLMGGLGLGMMVFGVGSLVTGMTDTVLKNFNDGNWAQSIKDNVTTLLSINQLIPKDSSAFKEGGGFIVLMSGLALGMMAFAVGSAASGMSQAVLDLFGQGDFAQKMYDQVAVLLSINQLMGGGMEAIKEGGTFGLAMAGLAAGLVAFAGGQAFAGVVGFFVGDQAGKLKDTVGTLLSITDDMGDDPVYKATQFKSAMGVIGEGLSSFAGGSFMAALKGAGETILGFFGLGSDSPFDAILGVAKNADALDKGANAIERMAFALEKIAPLNFKGNVSGQLQKLAQDLMLAVAPLEMAINGGTLPKNQSARLGLGRSDYEFKGLSSPELRIDDAVATVNKIRQMTSTLLGEYTDEVNAAQGAGSGTTVVNNNTTNSSGGTSAMMLPQSSPFPSPQTADILR